MRGRPLRQVRRSWACPPGCGTLEHTRARIEMYSEGILVQSTAELADEFDYQGIMRLTEEHKRRFADFARQARLVYPDCLPLTAGRACCAGPAPIPTAPAATPNRRLSSMEAYGLFVSDVCTKSGLSYNYGPRTLTFTSCVLLLKEAPYVHTERDIPRAHQARRPAGAPAEGSMRRCICVWTILSTPICAAPTKRGTVSVDRWGTTISFPAGCPAPCPCTARA